MSGAEEIVGDLVEIGEDTLQLGTDVVEVVTQNNYVVLGGAVALSCGVAGYFGYRYGVHKTTLRYEDILAEQIEATKEFYERQPKVELYEEYVEGQPEPPKAVKGQRALVNYQGISTRSEPDEEGTVTVTNVVETVQEVAPNVFTDYVASPEDWDQELEEKDRAVRVEDTPYVISFEEFFENEGEYEQVSLTWYPESRALVNTREELLDPGDLERLVGEDNLIRFGHGSNDPRVVYVRSDRTSQAFEIIKAEGTWPVGEPAETFQPRARRVRSSGE